MAKRVNPDEKPFSPVSESLVLSVLTGGNNDVEQNDIEEEAELRSPVPLEERFEREKRYLLTRTEERNIERLVSAFAAEIGTPLKLSHVVRACLLLVAGAEREILQQARRSGRTSRPSNGNMKGILEFERKVATVLLEGIRKGTPL